MKPGYDRIALVSISAVMAFALIFTPMALARGVGGIGVGGIGSHAGVGSWHGGGVSGVGIPGGGIGVGGIGSHAGVGSWHGGGVSGVGIPGGGIGHVGGWGARGGWWPHGGNWWRPGWGGGWGWNSWGWGWPSWGGGCYDDCVSQGYDPGYCAQACPYG